MHDVVNQPLLLFCHAFLPKENPVCASMTHNITILPMVESDPLLQMLKEKGVY
jgi:hypothetical protein